MTNTNKPRRAVGGSAAERGLDFQSRVNAIVMANLLSERPLGWLGGVMDDTPLEVDAETGGPGDDIRFVAKGGKQIEVQAKRGLQRGVHLWDAVLSLARGVSDGAIDGGVLAVCPNSSGTIREDLSEDIVRLGEGRFDGLRAIGMELLSHLRRGSVDPGLACQRLRIIVVSAVDGNREAEVATIERLSRIARDPQAAWDVLVNSSRRLIRTRGRATLERIYQDLSLAGVTLKTDEVETRAQVLSAMKDWLHKTYAQITLVGVQEPASFEECWLELDVRPVEDGLISEEELAKALQRYHNVSRGASGQEFQSRAVGRFVNRCVVLGGPGMGKSTLLKKLALDYSSEGFLTLLVKLPQVAALVSHDGRRFEDGLVEVALSGSGIRASLATLDGSVVLCDGLDECGHLQPIVTAALHTFSIAHPRARIVVTSRPIGYRSGEIGGWRHYELQSFGNLNVREAVTQVLEAIPFSSESERNKAITLAKDQLKVSAIKHAAARSPLMVSLVAALTAKGINPGQGKAVLYRQLFQLIEDHPPARLAEKPPTAPERSRFLELLGWSLLKYGIEPADEVFRRCSRWWSDEAGLSFFASEARVRACFEYWECLGVLERVRTLTQEAVTFVHKTFGEFAAARYICKCDPTIQRSLVTQAIQSSDWQETLSFASHLGLATLILEVCVLLADAGDTSVGYRMDDVIELVVQAGVPIDDSALVSFVECCWKAVANRSSRARYAAGEALCIASTEHWAVVRANALDRLEDVDGWSRLVAWACLCVSPESNISLSGLISVLQEGPHLAPTTSYLSGLHLGPTGNAVWQKLVSGATQRILSSTTDPQMLGALTDVIKRGKDLNLGSLGVLATMFKQFGLELPVDDDWSSKMASLVPDKDTWNREALYFLDLVEDPTLAVDDGTENLRQSWELGALLTAAGYWSMSASESHGLSMGSDATASRRRVIYGVAKAAQLDAVKLTRQARAWRKHILEPGPEDHPALFDIPQVDVDVQFDTPVVGIESIPELEQIILGGGEFFPLNAGQLLYGLRKQPEYRGAIERLIRTGRGYALKIAATLAGELADEVGQELYLDRLCTGEMTSGCGYLYSRLNPPFDERHLQAMKRGLDGRSAEIAKAACYLAEKLSISESLLSELRSAFEQWKAKEEPYPKSGGIIPSSPRGALAKIIVAVTPNDHTFLLDLLRDERPDVRAAAQEPLLLCAANSRELRARLVQEVASGSTDPSCLRSVIAKGLYVGDDAMAVVGLLRSSDARVRYAALSILDERFLPADLVKAECAQLMVDSDTDICEAASRAIKKVAS